jgi:hypothetical protein
MPYRLTRKAKAARDAERQRRAQATRDRNRMANGARRCARACAR